jgi:MoxR-like ATPase
VVVLTSNRSREIGDALRRRCLYLYVEHPPFDKELRILRGKVPAVSEQLATTVTRFVQKLRGQPLRKLPGVAETLDWAQALSRLHHDALDAETTRATLGCLLKDEQDIKATGENRLAELLAYASARD